MNVEEIKKQLDEELKDTGWVYKHWKNDNQFEFRNTGRSLSEDEAEERIDEFIDGLERGSFRSMLTGKLCIEKTENGTLLKKHVGDHGEPSGTGERMTDEEVKDFLKKKLRRIDCDILPKNIVLMKGDDIIDIYSERVRGIKLVTINMEGKDMITLRDDGGLQFESV